YVPKNACTTLKTYFADLLGLEYEVVHDAPFEYTNDFNSYPDYFHFAVVRHPLNRLYSLYKDKINSEKVNTECFTEGVQNIVFRDFMDKFWAGMGFNDFCKSISSIPYHLADPHYAPQYTQLPPVNIYLMRKENLQEEVEKVFPRLGLSPEIGFYNSGGYSDRWNNELSSVIAFNAVGAYYFEDFKRYNYE